MQKKNPQRIVLPVLVFIFVIGGWEVYVRAFHISLYILPAPSKVVQALVQNWDILMKHSIVTLQEALLGLGISTVFAILISIGMDLSKTIRTSLYPYLIVTQTVPVMVLGPLFSIWFGFDLLPKVLIVVFMCFFPIAVSLTDALQQVDPKNQSGKKLRRQHISGLFHRKDSCRSDRTVFRTKGSCHVLCRRSDRRRMAVQQRRSGILHAACEERVHAR